MRAHDAAEAARLAGALRRLGVVLGLAQGDAEIYLQTGSREHAALGKEDVERLIAERNSARKNKNWAESDRIRDLLHENNIILEDGSAGTTWRRE